jgi:hypothetical protein
MATSLTVLCTISTYLHPPKPPLQTRPTRQAHATRRPIDPPPDFWHVLYEFFLGDAEMTEESVETICRQAQDFVAVPVDPVRELVVVLVLVLSIPEQLLRPAGVARVDVEVLNAFPATPACPMTNATAANHEA